MLRFLDSVFSTNVPDKVISRTDKKIAPEYCLNKKLSSDDFPLRTVLDHVTTPTERTGTEWSSTYMEIHFILTVAITLRALLDNGTSDVEKIDKHILGVMRDGFSLRPGFSRPTSYLVKKLKAKHTFQRFAIQNQKTRKRSEEMVVRPK